MNGSKIDNLLAGAALTLSAGTEPGLARRMADRRRRVAAARGLLAVGLTLAGGSALLRATPAARLPACVERHFEALCRLDPQTCASDPTAARTAAAAAGQSLRGVAEQSGETVLGLAGASRTSNMRAPRWRSAAAGRRRRPSRSGTSSPALPSRSWPSTTTTRSCWPTAAPRNCSHIDAREGRNARRWRSWSTARSSSNCSASTRQRKTAGHRTEEIEIADAEGHSHWYRATAVKLAAAGRGRPASRRWPRAPWPCSATSAIRRRCRSGTPSSSPRSATR